MSVRLLLLASALATTTAAFVGGAAPARLARVCPVNRPAASRCAAPLLKAEGDGEDETWSDVDDRLLSEYMKMRHDPSAARCGEADSVLRDVDGAWVLIFNQGRPDEGVYTLQGKNTPTASAYVLSFERVDDADRFAQLLQAEGFDLATPLNWDKHQLSNFCSQGGFEVSLVPTGGMLTPPTKNEYHRDGLDPQEEVADAFASQRALFERAFRGSMGDDGPGGRFGDGFGDGLDGPPFGDEPPFQDGPQPPFGLR